VKRSTGSVVTIGTYDGVHRGHQRLIGEARSDADRLGLRSVVVTFDRHPSQTVRPNAAPRLITDLEFKLELIEAIGVDEVVVLRFDRERANETPEQFVEDLVTDLEAVVVVVGENFRFGHDHRGDVALLERLGGDLGFSARGLSLVTDEASQVVVSSKVIREMIANGALTEVHRFLGRPFELRGTWSSGGVIVVSDDLCRPVEGKYGVAIRRPGADPSLVEVEAVVAADGTVTVPTDAVPVGTDEGDVVGVCFVDPD
jgi:riboflavin kinase/FMN adenylyltransferase